MNKQAEQQDKRDRDPVAFAAELKSRRAALMRERPGMRARNIADALGVAEGELLACRAGDGGEVVRLADNPREILKSILPLGEVMALTRNENCVHERKGVYDNGSFFSHGKMSMGLFVNPDIDLRLFMNHWRFCFAAAENGRRSVQFFDRAGAAVHKIYLTDKSDAPALDALVGRFRHPEREPFIRAEPTPPRPEERGESEVDWRAFRAAWENLKDTHDFHPMLRRFKVARESAFRNIGADFARRAAADAPRRVLEAVRDRECDIMVFVGNRGCIQIHTGPVKKLLAHGPWFNVLDPQFNLHLREDRVASCWVTRKPTADGVVTALEVFDDGGEIIVAFFGRRKPGIPELPLWREIAESLPALEGDDA